MEQLDALPALVESFGFAIAKAAGYEADDFLAAGAAGWAGPVVVTTSDRDAFQLVSDRVTVLQPVKGVSELARIGPAEVRERYGVDPEQVPDFIALRGDSSDRIPGAPGIGPKSAATILGQYGTLEAALVADRLAPIADDLRLYRRIATMDAAAPVPPLVPTPPDWARAEAARARARAERPRPADRRARLAMDVVSHEAFARLHPTGGHPESQGRIRVLHERFPFVECAPASEEDVLRCHTPALLERVRTTRGWLDPDTVCTETTFDAALLAAGAAIEAARRGGFALARPPGHHAEAGPGDGLLPLRLDRDRRPLGAGRARARPGRDPRLGRPPRERDTGDRRRRPVDPLRLAPPVAVLSRDGGPDEQGETLVNLPLAAGTGDDGYLAAFERAEAAVAAFEPELLLVSAGFDAHVDDPLAQLELSTGLFEELARRAAALAPRVAAVLEGGYNLETLPDLVESALRGFG